MSFVDDIVSKGYGGYRGWDPRAAEEDYKKTGGQGKWDPGSSQQYSQQSNQSSYQAPSIQPVEDLVAKAQEMYQRASQPAIQSLEAQKPEIQATIKNKTQLLTDRYSQLVNDIKGGQTKAETRQTTVTAGELGKRGIDPTSTLYGQELTNALNPITSEYTSLLKNAALDQTTGQQDLANLETEQLRNLANSIAQIRTGSNTNAISTALQQYQANQNAAMAAQQAQADQAYKNQQLALQQQQLAEQQRLSNLEWPYKQKIYEYQLGKPYYKNGIENGVSNDPLGLGF